MIFKISKSYFPFEHLNELIMLGFFSNFKMHDYMCLATCFAFIIAVIIMFCK